jgi:hypothetical protein
MPAHAFNVLIHALKSHLILNSHKKTEGAAVATAAPSVPICSDLIRSDLICLPALFLPAAAVAAVSAAAAAAIFLWPGFVDIQRSAVQFPAI